MNDPRAIRALLVDDSRAIRDIQRGILTQLGATMIEEARDGFDALSKIGSFNPNLILIDWNMPNMDGLTLVKRLRAMGRDTPVIMVTTEAERSRVIDAINAGVSAYIVKPFTPDLLHQRIVETLDKLSAA